jgi:putative inorganic carbon (HCO3(-)) transporter
MTPARLARILVAAELPIVILIAPALLFPTPTRLVVLAIVPVLWLAARMTTGEVVPRTPLNVATSVLLVMVAVSLIATFDVRFSLGKVSGVILGVLLFWSVTRWLTTPHRLYVGTAVFVLLGALLAIVGILGSEGSDKLVLLRAITSSPPAVIRGVPGAEEGFNPNALSGCLVLFVPMQIALLATGTLRRMTSMSMAGWSPRWVDAAQWIVLVTTVGTLILMQSRGAWAGLLAAGVAFLMWHTPKTRLAAAAGVGTAAVLWVLFGSASVLDRAVSRSGAGISDTVSGRIDIWTRALYAIQDVPFTGMGMNTFRRVMPVLYPSQEIAAGKDVAHAHNHLLQVALDLGIPGLVAYLAIWIGTATLLVLVYRGAANRAHRVIAGGLGAGLTAHFVFGMTDAIPLGAKVGMLFWLTLALSTGLHRVALSPRAGN